MTKFWRDGHYRTSQLGNTYWVDGHWVYRDDWNRASYASAIHVWTPSASHTAAFVNPNAKCPVCDKSVFFYQNEIGSRVYFDELGPPWPKHPCTDSNVSQQRETKEELGRDHMRRSYPHPIDEKDRDRSYERETKNRDASFNDLYGDKPWLPMSVKDVVRETDTVLVIAKYLEGLQATKFIVITEGNEVPDIGTAIFIRGTTIAFFDFSNFCPIQYEVEVRSQQGPVRKPGKRAKRKKRRKMSRRIKH